MSRNNHETRKIKIKLENEDKIISHRRIVRIMKQGCLVSNYTMAQFKPYIPKCNEYKIENVLERKFHKQPKHHVVISVLTYIRVGKTWNYICILINLFNRKIIGYNAGTNKDSNLVMQAFSKVRINLKQIQLFHTNRGNELKNKQNGEILKTFEIERSLSMKGCSYDNAVMRHPIKS